MRERRTVICTKWKKRGKVICACPVCACRILSGAIIHVSGPPPATIAGYSLPDIPHRVRYIDPLEIALQVNTRVFSSNYHRPYA